MNKLLPCVVITAFFFLATFAGELAGWQKPPGSGDLDARVQQFLESRRGTWRDMNIPAADGQVLHDIIVEHKYRNALEIDRSRHEEALANFREAGLSQYIDARLGDAHKIVPSLPGPFDFVFSDADKDWYTNYLTAVLPKLTVGGCFVAHNVSENSYGGSREFLEYVRSLPYLETTVTGSGYSGMSITYRRAGAQPPR